MPSPFPGMNPWIEQPSLWPDFHVAFVPEFRRRLARQVLPKYIVLMEEQIDIHELASSTPRSLRPDLAVTRPKPLTTPARQDKVGVAELEAPAHPRLPDEDIERVPYLEVRDRESRELVAVVELLSPSKKRRGDDQGKYLEKRRAVLKSSAHLIEIDLLRDFDPLPLEDRRDCDYSVLVSRADRRPVVDFWPIGIRDRLPVIPIPLRAPDGEAQVDLQEVLHQVYDDAGYAHFIYRGAPVPPLSAAEAEWSRRFFPE